MNSGLSLQSFNAENAEFCTKSFDKTKVQNTRSETLASSIRSLALGKNIFSHEEIPSYSNLNFHNINYNCTLVASLKNASIPR
jgi:hypothetical protein